MTLTCGYYIDLYYDIELWLLQAFDLAEKEFGIRAMMSGEDMSMCDSPDLATMVSYLSQFYELFRKEVKVFKGQQSYGQLTWWPLVRKESYHVCAVMNPLARTVTLLK